MHYGNNSLPYKITRLFATVGAAFALLSVGLQTGSRGDTPTFTSHTDSPGASGTSNRTDSLPDNYKTSLKSLLHWGHFPLRVAFVNGIKSGDHDMDTLVRNGFDEWVNATQNAIRYEVVSNSNRADVTVTYDIVPARPLTGERLGQTGFTFNPARRQLVRASMHLNVWEGMTRRDLARFENTAAHEFGHALGINGHSPNPGDLMYYSSASSEGVTVRDINTLRLAYGNFERSVARATDSKTKRM